jgi:hypothetical protein
LETQTWDGIGLFISSVKSGQKACPAKPGGAWKEWADEAISRCLMSHSRSWNGDILIYFVNGVQMPWSKVQLLSWSEIETIARGTCQEAVVDYAA